MTNEERDLITQFITRVGGAPAQPSSGFSSVPNGGANPALPPVDRDADALIGDLLNRNPEARYRITQLAFVQEHALAAAQARINELTNALNQARGSSQAGAGASPWGGQPGAGQPQQQRSGGFLSNLFGGGAGAPPPRPQPQYAPPPPPPQYGGYGQMPPAMAANSGSGFLGGALRTAAGVAGGVVAGNALMNMLGGGHGGGMFGGGISSPGGFMDQNPGASSWSDPNAGVDPFAQGGAAKDDGSAPVADNSGWQDTSAQPQDTGWTDTSNVADSGWTDASSGSDSGGGSWDDTSNS